MPDYKALVSEWHEILARRRAMGDALSFWTPVLEGWRDWDDGGVTSLGWTGDECRQHWARGVPLLADAEPALAPESLEDLLGPLMERLAVGSSAAAEPLAWRASWACPGIWWGFSLTRACAPLSKCGSPGCARSPRAAGSTASARGAAGCHPTATSWKMDAGGCRVICAAGPGRPRACVVRSARRDSRATWCGWWPRVRRRATSSRRVSRAAATSRASIAASGGTGPLPWWKTGPRPISTTTRHAKATGAPPRRSPSSCPRAGRIPPGERRRVRHRPHRLYRGRGGRARLARLAARWAVAVGPGADRGGLALPHGGHRA